MSEKRSATSMLEIGNYRRDSDQRKRTTWPFYHLSDEDRTKHIWVLGKSGTGKSEFISRCVAQDLKAGNGFAVFDPHGDLSDKILSLIPPARRSDVLYLNPADREYPIGFNVLEKVDLVHRPMIANAVVDAFHSIWADSWGPQLELFLTNAVQLCLDVPGHGTLLGVKYIFTSKKFRRYALGYCKDPVIKSFWETDFAIHM